jgi:hypothetical protein
MGKHNPAQLRALNPLLEHGKALRAFRKYADCDGVHDCNPGPVDRNRMI